MTLLIAASVLFLIIHLAVSGTRLRDGITARIGEGVYMGAFSVASLATITLMAMGYNDAVVSPANTPLWAAPSWLVHIGALLMLIAFVFAFAGNTTPSPTAVQAPGAAASAIAGPKGIHRITRHPFLWSVLIWAGYHLIMNGDLASLTLFGTFVVLTGLGTRAIDGKRARKMGPAWELYASQTSNVPFVAIAQGRNSLALGEIAWWQWLGGVGLFLVFFFGHQWLFSVPAYY